MLFEAGRPGENSRRTEVKIQQIRDIARRHGLPAGKLGKIGLIRAIQRNEGNFDCFATAREGVCDRYDCLWREDCFALAALSRAARH